MSDDDLEPYDSELLDKCLDLFENHKLDAFLHDASIKQEPAVIAVPHTFTKEEYDKVAAYKAEAPNKDTIMKRHRNSVKFLKCASCKFYAPERTNKGYAPDTCNCEEGEFYYRFCSHYSYMHILTENKKDCPHRIKNI